MKTIAFLVIALSILGIAGTASADTTWNQLFQQSSTETYQGAPVGTFDQIDIFWQSGDKFSAPAFTGFTVAGWTNTNISSTEAYGAGPDSNFLQFYLNFNNVTPPAGAVFLTQTSLDGQVVQRQTLTYSALNGWTWPQFEGDNKAWTDAGGTGPLAVPEPVSTVLFLLGGATLAVRRVYKSKKS